MFLFAPLSTKRNANQNTSETANSIATLANDHPPLRLIIILGMKHRSLQGNAIRWAPHRAE